MNTRKRKKTVKDRWVAESRPGAREEEKCKEREGGAEIKENNRRNQCEWDGKGGRGHKSSQQ